MLHLGRGGANVTQRHTEAVHTLKRQRPGDGSLSLSLRAVRVGQQNFESREPRGNADVGRQLERSKSEMKIDEVTRYTENFLEKLWEGLGRREHSLVHGLRHTRTVVNIASAFVKGLDEDCFSEAKVTLGALLHDVVRFLPQQEQAKGLDHATASAQFAERFLQERRMSESVAEEITDAISHHTGGGSRSLTGRILYSADKIEQLCPIAPFRRAVFVGEMLADNPLSPQSSVAEYLIYFLEKVGKLSYESIAQIGIEVPDGVREDQQATLGVCLADQAEG